jgi:antirestriction protein ArdC
VAQAMGPDRLRWIQHAGQRRNRPSLSRRQSLPPQHVTSRLYKRRFALVQLPASGGARMAGAPRREGDARLFLQADRDRGQTTGGGSENRRIPMLRTFSVFHASQIDGVPALAPPTATKTVSERIKDAELIIEASGVPVRIGGERAFYNRALDVIQMPPDEAFHSPEQRAVVVLHELAHDSGHPTRLNRDLSGGFGSVRYAKEELRAELTSVAVGSMIGLPCDIPNHASYLQSWIAVIKEDRREIFHAAAEAQRMADYILGFHPDYAETPSESADAEDESPTSIAPPLAA